MVTRAGFYNTIGLLILAVCLVCMFALAGCADSPTGGVGGQGVNVSIHNYGTPAGVGSSPGVNGTDPVSLENLAETTTPDATTRGKAGSTANNVTIIIHDGGTAEGGVAPTVGIGRTADPTPGVSPLPESPPVTQAASPSPSPEVRE